MIWFDVICIICWNNATLFLGGLKSTDSIRGQTREMVVFSLCRQRAKESMGVKGEMSRQREHVK